jgi:hypothetical protein
MDGEKVKFCPSTSTQNKHTKQAHKTSTSSKHNNNIATDMATNQAGNTLGVHLLTHYPVHHTVFGLPTDSDTRHAVYVESGDRLLQPEGWLFEATNDPSIWPMGFNDKKFVNPLSSGEYASTQLIGWVHAHQCLENVRGVCMTVSAVKSVQPNHVDSQHWANAVIHALTADNIMLPPRPKDREGRLTDIVCNYS